MPKVRAYTQEVKGRITLIRDLLRHIHKTKESLHDVKVFQSLAQAIQDTEIEALLASDKKHKKTCELIHHILYTPWGAPFVTEHSLLVSAQNYKFQDHFDSDLYKFIKNFLEHDQVSERQTFKALDDILESL